jgi:hypothetical protein
MLDHPDWAMRLAAVPSTVGGVEASTRFSTPQLFGADARLAFVLINHLRHKALHRVFGISRESANLLTVVLLLSAADGVYGVARRISRVRLGVSGTDAAMGASVLRETALTVAGPSARQVPWAEGLLVLAILGGLAPGLKRMAQGTYAAEQRLRSTEERVRRERIRRYVEARDHVRASAE